MTNLITPKESLIDAYHRTADDWNIDIDIEKYSTDVLELLRQNGLRLTDFINSMKDYTTSTRRFASPIDLTKAAYRTMITLRKMRSDNNAQLGISVANKLIKNFDELSDYAQSVEDLESATCGTLEYMAQNDHTPEYVIEKMSDYKKDVEAKHKEIYESKMNEMREKYNGIFLFLALTELSIKYRVSRPKFTAENLYQGIINS